MSPRII
jgi:hypothetical protein